MLTIFAKKHWFLERFQIRHWLFFSTYMDIYFRWKDTNLFDAEIREMLFQLYFFNFFHFFISSKSLNIYYHSHQGRTVQFEKGYSNIVEKGTWIFRLNAEKESVFCIYLWLLYDWNKVTLVMGKNKAT